MHSSIRRTIAPLVAAAIAVGAFAGPALADTGSGDPSMRKAGGEPPELVLRKAGGDPGAYATEPQGYIISVL
jgi:hypothetical protein